MTDFSIGVLIQRRVEYGYRYVTASVVVRKSGERHPMWPSWLNASHEVERKYHNLTIEGYASKSDSGGFWMERPHYRDITKVELGHARIMADMLAKLDKARLRAEATEPGDVFYAFAKSLKVEWVCMTDDGFVSDSFDKTKWRWRSVEDGRNHFRYLVHAAQEAASEVVKLAA